MSYDEQRISDQIEGGVLQEKEIMEQLTKLKELLIKRRNIKMATLVEKAEETDGYFDAMDHSGGNFDDAFNLGKDVGEAELIEELLIILNIE